VWRLPHEEDGESNIGGGVQYRRRRLLHEKSPPFFRFPLTRRENGGSTIKETCKETHLRKHMCAIRPGKRKETHKREPQKRPIKETYKRDLQRDIFKETCV